MSNFNRSHQHAVAAGFGDDDGLSAIDGQAVGDHVDQLAVEYRLAAKNAIDRLLNDKRVRMRTSL
jgi:hypothetical protein